MPPEKKKSKREERLEQFDRELDQIAASGQGARAFVIRPPVTEGPEDAGAGAEAPPSAAPPPGSEQPPSREQSPRLRPPGGSEQPPSPATPHPLAEQPGGPQPAPGSQQGEVWFTDEYYGTPNVVDDALMRRMSLPMQSVYRQLFRLTYGHHRRRCRVSLPRLAERTGMEISAVRRAVRRLEEHGYIKRLVVDYDNPNPELRGFEFEVVMPEGAVFEERAPRAKQPPGRKQGGSSQPPMKLMKENMKNPVYRIREMGLQLREQRRGDESYTRADLREDLKRQCAEQEVEYNDALVEEALGKVGL